jgi:TatD DNase family protein
METRGLIDFHCHLDLYPDHAAAIRQCEEDGVFTLTVTTTPKAWARNHQLTKDTRYVRAALGLHPQLVAERASEVALWEELAPQTRYIGEVGLDAGPRFYRSLDLQKEVFAKVLRVCASAGDKILTVHSVRATKAVLDAIEANLPPGRGKIVLHWFTGTAAEARRAVELGCYFSINNEMLAGEKRASIVGALPFGRLLTETDGPFTEIDGRPSFPKDVARCIHRLATLLRRDEKVIAEGIRSNLKSLLGDG